MVKTVGFLKRESREWEKGPEAKKRVLYKAWLCLGAGTSRNWESNPNRRPVSLTDLGTFSSLELRKNPSTPTTWWAGGLKSGTLHTLTSQPSSSDPTQTLKAFPALTMVVPPVWRESAWRESLLAKDSGNSPKRLCMARLKNTSLDTPPRAAAYLLVSHIQKSHICGRVWARNNIHNISSVQALDCRVQ